MSHPGRADQVRSGEQSQPEDGCQARASARRPFRCSRPPSMIATGAQIIWSALACHRIGAAIRRADAALGATITALLAVPRHERIRQGDKLTVLYFESRELHSPAADHDYSRRSTRFPTGAFTLCRARTRTMALSWFISARQAARRYSLINPWTTCRRLIRLVMSTGWPGSCNGFRCSRDWCGRCLL